MKRIVSILVLASAVLLGGAASAFATDKQLLTQEEFEARARRAESLAERVRRIHTYQNKLNKLRGGKWKPRGPLGNVPELDASVAGSAFALLVGGALVVSDRRRRATV